MAAYTKNWQMGVPPLDQRWTVEIPSGKTKEDMDGLLWTYKGGVSDWILIPSTEDAEIIAVSQYAPGSLTLNFKPWVPGLNYRIKSLVAHTAKDSITAEANGRPGIAGKKIGVALDSTTASTDGQWMWVLAIFNSAGPDVT